MFLHHPTITPITFALAALAAHKSVLLHYGHIAAVVTKVHLCLITGVEVSHALIALYLY